MTMSSLERIAQEMGVRTTLLESVDERQQSWLDGVHRNLSVDAQQERVGTLCERERICTAPR